MKYLLVKSVGCSLVLAYPFKLLIKISRTVTTMKLVGFKSQLRHTMADGFVTYCPYKTRFLSQLPVATKNTAAFSSVMKVYD
jgi:hypothetical protein